MGISDYNKHCLLLLSLTEMHTLIPGEETSMSLEVNEPICSSWSEVSGEMHAQGDTKSRKKTLYTS